MNKQHCWIPLDNQPMAAITTIYQCLFCKLLATAHTIAKENKICNRLKEITTNIT